MADVEFDLDFETKQAIRQLSKFSQGLAKNEKQVSKSQRALDKFLAPLKTRGGKALFAGITAGLLAVTGITVKAAKSFLTFDKSIRGVNTLLGASEKDLRVVAGRIQDVSIQSGLATTELAGTFKDLISASFTQAQAFDVLNVAAISARGGFTDIQDVTPGLIAAIRTFGVTAGDAADKIASVTKKGVGISVGQVAKALQSAGGIAKNAGLDLDDFAAALAKLTETGLSAELATTQLGAALRELTRGDVIKKITAATKSGSVVDIRDVGLENVVLQLQKIERRNLNNIFSDEGLRGILGLLNVSENTIGRLIKFSQESAGLAEEQARLSEGVGFDLEKSFARINVAFEKLGGDTATAFVSVIEAFSKSIEKSGPLIDVLGKTAIVAANALLFASKIVDPVKRVINFATGVGNAALAIGNIAISPLTTAAVSAGLATATPGLTDELFSAAAADFSGAFGGEKAEIATRQGQREASAQEQSQALFVMALATQNEHLSALRSLAERGNNVRDQIILTENAIDRSNAKIAGETKKVALITSQI